MNSPIPPYPEKPRLQMPTAEDVKYIRRWLMERVAVQNLIDKVQSLPTAKVGWNGNRAAIQG
jgi:hypothetical protein